MSKPRYGLPAWTGPESPQSPVPLTEELSLACQWARCQDCGDEDECLCDCHIDDPGDDDG